MRYSLLVLAFLSFPVFSDAYKCRSPNGQTVFTESPCDVGSTLSKSAKSDSVDAGRAQMELERQRGWLAGREKVKQQDSINARDQALAVERLYPPEAPKPLKSESIMDKPWGCGNRSCSQTATGSIRR